MRKISTFCFLTINGYYKGSKEDISWHIHSEEGNRFSEEQLKSGNVLLFGRVTYEMMQQFWTSEEARSRYPEVARMMNEAEKVVLSRTLSAATWQNSRLISENALTAIRQFKATAGKNITILGSGSIVRQLSEMAMIDEYQFMIDPLAIGKGTPLFEGLEHTLSLKLKETDILQSTGTLLLTYERKD